MELDENGLLVVAYAQANAYMRPLYDRPCSASIRGLHHRTYFDPRQLKLACGRLFGQFGLPMAPLGLARNSFNEFLATFNENIPDEEYGCDYIPVYSSEGVLIRKIGIPEYNNYQPNSLCISSADEILLFDRNNLAISVFSQNGSLMRKCHIPSLKPIEYYKLKRI